ncbi:MAG: L-2-hydroxyglutarate oxidase [Paraglaciecola sp.]|jgi:L-2-hydroxyglutarate oxidase
MNKFDIVIVGAGIIGAATAWQLQQDYPAKKILLLEKEKAPGLHQTGRNSGVIHAGVYYPANSLKSQYCKQGLTQTIEFCRRYQLPYLQCGKLLVATEENELPRMHELFTRCQQNKLSPILLDEKELKQREPNIRGLAGMYVKQTAITDYSAITQTLIRLFRDAGGIFACNQKVEGLHENVKSLKVVTQNERFETQQLVNCSGLMTDRIISLLGIPLDFQILPFRGEYFKLPNKYNALVNHLIYPIPDPTLPFLGVHLTRMIDGSVCVGPNAVLAMAREGYKKSDFSLKDSIELLRFKGLPGLAKNHARNALLEMKNSWFKRGYLHKVQRYCPQIQLRDLLPYPSGIRAQAVSNSGELIHDFKFVETTRSLHVANAPSPAATSALPIAKHISQVLSHRWA